MAQALFQKYLTPAGIAQYPALTKPDTRFNDDGVFKTTMIFEDTKEIRALIEKLEGVRDEFYGELEAKKRKTYKVADVYENELDDAGEETGRLIMKFKLNHIVRPKGKEPFTQHPNLFDCSKPPVALKGVNPWSGSTLKIAGEIVPYAMASSKTVGVSLRMKGVQVIDLVEGSGANAAAYGFDGSDGGFHQQADAGAEDFDADVDVDEDDDF
jgi:hypothetical protein